MKLKNRLILSLAALGLFSALAGGATFAYFSDREAVDNSFVAGTLDLAVDPSVAFDVKNLKPGDYMVRHFKIMNSGTLDIEDVLMHTDYSITDVKGDNGSEDFAEYLKVEFLTSDGQVILWNKTLKELKNMSPDISSMYSGLKNLPVGDSDTIVMKISFVDNGKDQNVFQGDIVHLTWTLDAKQGPGKAL